MFSQDRPPTVQYHWPDRDGSGIGGTFGYLISNRFARKLLTEMAEFGTTRPPLGDPVDYWMMRRTPPGIQAYMLTHRIVHSDYVGGGAPVDTDLQTL
jgi:hypothetical protein